MIRGVFVAMMGVMLGACQAMPMQGMPIQSTSTDAPAALSGSGTVQTISGIYMKWSGGCKGAPPVSRSDWMLIHPQYGCVYVHGLAMRATVGERVQIQGVWATTADGRRYIQAR